jgi:hypothetical protein
MANFDLRIGNYRELEIIVEKNDGTAPNFTGFSAKWMLYRLHARNPFLTKTDPPDVVIEDIQTATVVVRIYKEDTVDLMEGLYYHELVMIDPMGNETTVSSGDLDLYVKKR